MDALILDVRRAGLAGIGSDDVMVEVWLFGRPAATERAYRKDVVEFLRQVGAPMSHVSLVMLQIWSGGATVRAVKAVKSLFAFACKVGYLRFDPAAALRISVLAQSGNLRPSRGLSERILTEAEVMRVLGAVEGLRNRALCYLLYGTGIRREEAAGVQVEDVVDRGEFGQVTVVGKGGKVRAVLMYGQVWRLVKELVGLVGCGPLFVSRKGGGISESQVYRIVKAAAVKVGLGKVSPHWMRHASASHSLQNGADIAQVKEGLGHASLVTTTAYIHARPGSGPGRFLAVVA